MGIRQEGARGESDGSFSTRDLHRALAVEVTRADSDFVRSQAAAREAMERDLEPGEERIACVPLEISRVELELALVMVQENWLIRAGRAIWGWLGGEKPVAGEPRFRFAPAGTSGAQVVKCVVQRDARRRFRTLATEGRDA